MFFDLITISVMLYLSWCLMLDHRLDSLSMVFSNLVDSVILSILTVYLLRKLGSSRSFITAWDLSQNSYVSPAAESQGSRSAVIPYYQEKMGTLL